MSSYSKIDEHEQAKLEASRRTKKRIAIIAISSIVLVCIVVGAVVGTAANGNGKKPSKESDEESISVSVKAVCDVTLHKEKCFETVGSAPNASRLNPEELFKYAVKITIIELSKVLDGFSSGEYMDNATSGAMGACVELIELAVDQLNDTMKSMEDKKTTPFESIDDLRTWLSSVETYQETCMEALNEANKPSLAKYGETHMKNATEMTSNALAIITWLARENRRLR